LKNKLNTYLEINSKTTMMSSNLKAQLLLMLFKITILSIFATMSTIAAFGVYVLAFEEELQLYYLPFPAIITAWAFWGTYIAAEETWLCIQELRNMAKPAQIQQPRSSINGDDTQTSTQGTQGPIKGSVRTLSVEDDSVLTCSGTEAICSSRIFPGIFASSDDDDLLDIEDGDGESFGEHFFRYPVRDNSMQSLRTSAPVSVKVVGRKPAIVEVDFLPMSGVAEYGFIS
jgi:hypothetical protein